MYSVGVRHFQMYEAIASVCLVPLTLWRRVRGNKRFKFLVIKQTGHGDVMHGIRNTAGKVVMTL